MKILYLTCLAIAVPLLHGCASITQGTTHLLRIETATAQGELVNDAQCTLDNDQGVTIARSGGSTQVRRSSKDLQVKCESPGQPAATGRLVSRANAGLAGNILIGGGIGALLDHSTGAAYTYPGWVRLVFGQSSVFDRRDEREGSVMLPHGTTPKPAAVAAAVARAPRAQGQPGPVVEYRVSDRAGNRTHNVVLRGEHEEPGFIMFNDGARLEKVSGELVRQNALLLGELDSVTPPGGWMPHGRVPAGTWRMKHRSIVPTSFYLYDLEASAEGEQVLLLAGQQLRTTRVRLTGWVENFNVPFPARARYEATVWVAPDIQRVARFEVRARSSPNSPASFFYIDEAVELVKIGK